MPVACRRRDASPMGLPLRLRAPHPTASIAEAAQAVREKQGGASSILGGPLGNLWAWVCRKLRGPRPLVTGEG